MSVGPLNRPTVFLKPLLGSLAKCGIVKGVPILANFMNPFREVETVIMEKPTD